MRGYNFAEYHSDVYDKTESELTAAGLDCECLGGGRIEHKPDKKFIKVKKTDRKFSLDLYIDFSGLRVQHGVWES